MAPCSSCGKEGPLRPDDVLFGDNVPRKTKERASSIIDSADCLLCIGTSLQVGQPTFKQLGRFYPRSPNCLIKSILRLFLKWLVAFFVKRLIFGTRFNFLPLKAYTDLLFVISGLFRLPIDTAGCRTANADRVNQHRTVPRRWSDWTKGIRRRQLGFGFGGWTALNNSFYSFAQQQL